MVPLFGLIPVVSQNCPGPIIVTVLPKCHDSVMIVL
jgi:hypothetical protein